MNIDIVSASAGSGKTYRLAELLEQVVKNGEVRADAILATTFTIKAAAELKERVRTRLLGAGLTVQAQQLSASRIGTVNSVCGSLLSDFAFELGISPDQRVLEEDAVSGAINRAMARVIGPAESKELWLLEQCFKEIDTRKVIESIIAKARSNGIGSTDLLQCGKRSADEFVQLFADPADDGTDFYDQLRNEINSFLRNVDTEADTTKNTKESISTVQRLKGRLFHQKYLPWSEWLRLAKLKVGAKSRDAVAPLLLAASNHDRHPQLHRDAKRLITLVFDLAAKTLAEYQEYKRQWGVVDFTDQEALTLKLLQMEEPVRILQEKLDLVLVDEFQDTSPIQLAIFLKVAGLAKKSVWVGDQKQAIYGFRDADPGLMDAAINKILKGREPETLKFSWRSRPELVRSTSDVFVKAFSKQGFPEQRVRLEPAPAVEKKIPQGLGPVYECWNLESTKHENDVLALASAVGMFLSDENNTVRDQKTGIERRVRGGDIAILCRTNTKPTFTCVAVAEALEQQGLKAALPRPGLLACPEVVLTLAVVRMLVDSRDSLARAEIARLLDAPDDHNGWLQKALSQKFAGAFDLSIFTAIEKARESLKIAGPLEVLDAAMRLADVRSYCLSWGNSAERLANLDSLRSLCAGYVEECKSSGKGSSPAGLLAYFDALEADTKAAVQNEDTVQVLTWHRAKGLEWPVTILFQLDKVFSALPLGVNVVSDADFDFDNPLDNRWLRFWPNPYGNFKTGAPFHERILEHPATLVHQEKEERQELRLLYVGWTRARDKVVLAGRAGFLQKGLLRLLVDEDGEHLLDVPKDNLAVWAKRDVEVVQRNGKPMPPKVRLSQPGTGYISTGEQEYPVAFQAASSVAGEGNVVGVDRIGDRLALMGKPDMQLLGEAVHTFLGADDIKLEKTKRLSMADSVLRRWGIATNISAESLLQGSDSLHTYISNKWPDAIWYREYPVFLRRENGTIISGFIDLLLETDNGFVIIDHKCFPAGQDQLENKAIEYSGQLLAYQKALEAATDKLVEKTMIFFPISGRLVEVELEKDSMDVTGNN